MPELPYTGTNSALTGGDPSIVTFTALAKQEAVPYATLYGRAKKLGLVRYQNPDAKDPLQKGAGVEQNSVTRIILSPRGRIRLGDLSRKTGIDFATLYARAKTHGLLLFENPEGVGRARRPYILRTNVKQISGRVRGKTIRRSKRAARVAQSPQLIMAFGATPPLAIFEAIAKFLGGERPLDETCDIIGIQPHSDEYVELMRQYVEFRRRH